MRQVMTPNTLLSHPLVTRLVARCKEQAPTVAIKPSSGCCAAAVCVNKEDYRERTGYKTHS
jgi:hypothetical protein